jgi:acetamidase/formamidase
MPAPSMASRDVIRYVPRPDDYAWTFGGLPPVLDVRPGQVLSIFTEDAFGGRLRSADDVRSQFPDTLVNPQSGPFRVEGAEPGDTLAIHLIEVRPARDWAVSTTVPLFGALTGSRFTATLQPPLPEATWIYRVDAEAGLVWFRARDTDHETALPLEPFLGTIGVAPAAGEVRTTLVPEAFGGNMDFPEVTTGTTVYLGVNVPGALFSIGDGHCRQGEGEACGVAVEAAMETVLTVEVIKDVYCEWPRLETDGFLMAAGSYRPLEDAYRIAHVQLIQWLMAETGMSMLDTYQLVTQTTQARIANVCDPNYTVVAKAPKSALPADVNWMTGTHARLRKIAADVLEAGR